MGTTYLFDYRKFDDGPKFKHDNVNNSHSCDLTLKIL
jgi:hypothetical protein